MDKLAKRLEVRHINMIALGGSIGTGIFLASGYAIFIGGPGGALFAYILMSIMVYFLMCSLAEMSAYKPSSGSFCDYAGSYVSKSFGFSMSYNYWLSWATTIAVEISAASIIAQYWFPEVDPIVFSGIFFVGIIISNIFVVRVYGEIEYWLSMVKVGAIIIFIALSAVSLFSKPHFGLDNWTIPGAPFRDGWIGVMSVFLFVGYSFQGTELVGVASGETKNPQKTIPKAIGMVFWRLVLFYILSIGLISLLIPYNDPTLIEQNSIKTSPYTLVFSEYVGRHAADIVNLVILIALISAANASLYSSSRILWFMGKNRHAPKKFSYTTKKGVPLLALLLTSVFGASVFISSIVGSGVFFSYMLKISSLNGFIIWFCISLSHYKFRKNYIPKKPNVILKYKAKFYPFAQLFSIALLIIIIGGQIFTAHGEKYTILNILAIYSSVILVILIFIGHKIYSKIKGLPKL